MKQRAKNQSNRKQGGNNADFIPPIIYEFILCDITCSIRQYE